MAIKDILYRYYNCNIQAPKIKANEIYADKISFGTYTDNDVNLYGGKVETLGMTFEIDIPYLGQAYENNCGELTVYALNPLLNLAHVMMALITKSNSVMTTTSNIVVYQNFGNASITNATTGVTTDPSIIAQNNTKVIVAFPQNVYIKWVWRGYQ